VSDDPGSEPWTVATLAWTARSSNQSVRSHQMIFTCGFALGHRILLENLPIWPDMSIEPERPPITSDHDISLKLNVLFYHFHHDISLKLNVLFATFKCFNCFLVDFLVIG
jgi:hypothetical protein